MKESVGRVAAFLSLCAVAQGYTFDDIRFWVGEGTNRAAVVIDWGHEDGTPAVCVWGYRWNGNATAAQALLAIDEADTKLTMDATSSQYGLNIQGFTYDAGGETFDAGSEDFYEGMLMYGTYWALSSAEAGGEMQYASVGASSLALAPGGRVGMKWTYYSFNYETYAYDGGDPSIAEDAAVAAPAPAFTFDDIHYWVGEGTNRVAVVIDFNRNGYAPRVWGYRWDGTAPTMAAVIAAIAEEDNRLRYLSSQGSWGTSVDGFGYDLPDRAVTFQDDLSKATDVTALFGAYAGELYWAQAPGAGPDFASVKWTYGSGVDRDIPTDGGWYSFRLTNWMTGESSYPSDSPLPAETPYGWKVVSASTEAAGAMYGDPSVVLGRPLDYMKGQWGGPVSPYNPVWTAGAIYTLENTVDTNSHVTIAFDHRVYDDPANPYGLDFLVFGNSLFTGSTTDYYSETTDPAAVSFATSGGGDEPGLVEVSQDGTTWHAYASGPYADTAFPTLGRLYDPANPDTALFTGNTWWGRRADATLPVDPAIRREDIGTAPVRTLADLCIAYNGSAGGTGFDLADFPDLPADETGRKWIRFVRVKPAPTGEVDDDDGSPTYYSPEVDAVADVAPLPSYENWVRSNYSWKTVLTAPESRAKDAVAANGRSNAENAALGLAPDAVSSDVLRISGFKSDFKDGVARILVPGAARIDDLVRVASATNLAAATANWSVELPVYLGQDEGGENVFEIPLADADDARFYRIVVE